MQGIMSEEETANTDLEAKADRFPFVQRHQPNLKFLNAIPTQAQKGFKNINIIFKCIDVCEQYITVGTNIGVVYLYDRRRDKLHKLRSSDYTESISCVKLLVSLECLVSVGTVSGSVFAFKVSFKDEPEIEKFKVEGIHQGTVTALEWVKNGIKFFSGDANGIVVCTEIDHLEHQSLSEVIVEENNEIVQLSYLNQKLLVSTLQRCLIYDFRESCFYQVGVKDRKCQGRFGGIFFQDNSEECIFTCRPGQRIWKSDYNGVIRETVLLKSAFTVLSKGSSGNGFHDFQFGPLKSYCSEFLLNWSSNKIILIDPLLRTVKGIGHFPNIVEVSTCHDEIFVLQGLRNVIRLAIYSEDQEDFLVKDSPELFVPTEQFCFVDNKDDSNAKDKSNVKDNPNVFDWIKRKFSEVTIHPDDEIIEPAKSERSKTIASALPDVVKFDIDCPEIQISSDSPMHAFKDVTRTFSEGSEDIVYKPKKKKKKKKKVQFSSDSPSEVDISDIINGNLPADATEDAKLDNTSDSISTDCVDAACFNSETDNVVEKNADALMDTVSVSSVKEDSVSDDVGTSESISIEEISIDPPSPNNDSDGIHVKSEGVDINVEQADSDEVDFTVHYDSLFDIQDNNTFANSVNDSEEQVVPVADDGASTSESTSHVLDVPRYGVECIQHKSPGTIISLCASNLHMFCVDYQNYLYMSDFYKYTFHWIRLNQYAEQVAVSPSEKIVWVLYKGTVFSAKRCSVNTLLKSVEWVTVARSISYIAVADTCCWYITWDNRLFTHRNLSIDKPHGYPEKVYCPPNLTQLACSDDIVWAINAEGKLYYGVSNAKSSFEISKWKEIVLPSKSPVTTLSFAGDGVAYVSDQNDTLWFFLNVTSAARRGFKSVWQVESGTYVYETPITPAMKVVGKVINTELFTSFIHGQAQKIITSSGKGVWWCKSMDSLFHTCQKFVIGHNWEQIVPKGTLPTTKWDLVSAENYSVSQDVFWAYSSSGELMCSSLKKSNCIVVNLPNSINVQCIYSDRNSLWVLSTKGNIYTRREMSDRSPQGVWWQQLDTSQLCDINLIHMSCSSEVVWACDDRGAVFIRIGTLQPPAGTCLSQAWIQVDSTVDIYPIVQKSVARGKAFNIPRRSSQEKTRISKVYVGPKSHMVWAIDDKGLVYVRNGITSSLLVGNAWLIIPGPRAKQLCISSSAVWLVKYSGKLFRRFGITKSNSAGDYWKQIPGKMSFLSVTQDDDLWGVHDNYLCRHYCHIIEYEGQNEKKDEDTADISDDDWEDVAADFLDDDEE